MTDPSGPVVSVRAEARRTVAPDYATLSSAITVSRGSKAAALQAAGAALERLTADLASLGGVPLTVDTGRRPLTWSAGSATTRLEREHNEQTGRLEPTGRVTATVFVVMAIRAFETLDALDAVLANHETLAVHGVEWDVDRDNPAWPEVRAAAIHAAIGKGHDYADALGGSLHQVEQIADVGLLGGESAPEAQRLGAFRGRAAGFAEPPDTPSLDPVPQELTATIEARFTTVGVSLTEH